MTKSNLLFGAAIALAAGMLAGCSKEPAAENQIQTVDRDQVRYLNVAISSPTGMGTRATNADTDFLQGSENENFVKNMTFVFYDAKGNPTGEAYDISNLEADENGANKATDGFTNTTGNVGKFWQNTVPVKLNQGDNLPAYVMCFINPVVTNDFKAKTLKEIEDVVREKVVLDDGTFPMTNSVYYGNSAAGSNVRVFATPINADQLYTSSDKAKAAENPTEIYVERYAARVQLSLENIYNYDVNGYTLTFVPEFWRPNAIDQQTYAVKRFGLIEEGKANYDPAYTNLLANFDNKTWWNEPEKFRSYWGCSPSYYTNKYPKVSDDITDFAPNNDYGAGRAGYPYDVHYFNYEQIKNNTVGGGVSFQPSIAWDKTNGFNEGGTAKVYYAREATTASSAWGYKSTIDKSYNPLASLPSAVIVGHYTVAKTNAADATVADVPAGQPTFYLYGQTNDKYNLYFESNIKAAMLRNQNVIVQGTTTGEGESAVTTYAPYREPNGFNVEHPSKEVRNVDAKNPTSVAGRLVALQLNKDNLQTNLYYYDATKPEGQKYVNITTTNINTANSILLSTGYATQYGEGIAYFNIPIEHLGIYDETTGEYVRGAKADGKYDFTKCPAGSFGIVRNHAYTIKVTKIEGLGTALRDKKQPIVPPVDETTYYISAKVNILNWRIVPTQNVTL